MSGLDVDLAVPVVCFLAVLGLVAYELRRGPRVLEHARAGLRRDQRRQLLADTRPVPLWPLEPLQSFWPDELLTSTTDAVGAPVVEARSDLEEGPWVREA